jgi:hypothetical protein
MLPSRLTKLSRVEVQEPSRGLYFDPIDRILRCWFLIQSKAVAPGGGVASGDAGGGSGVDVGQCCDADIGATTDSRIDAGAGGRGTRRGRRCMLEQRVTTSVEPWARRGWCYWWRDQQTQG